MPVTDGIFVPRTPLTPAELHIDWVRHDNEIVARRRLVEQAAAPKARKLADAAILLGHYRNEAQALTDTLAVALDRTARFGYREAQHEIAQLRLVHPVTAAANPPAPGRLSDIVRQGLAGVALYVRQEALLLTEAVIAKVLQALRSEADQTLAVLIARKEAAKRLHVGVLDLVGTTLNLGRTAGATVLDMPPTFALRSEQLDRNTCKPCDGLHGSIVRFGSPEYFSTMPPLGCLGGGRCRGLYVFADGPREMRAPELIAA
jgi:hypothetical protein